MGIPETENLQELYRLSGARVYGLSLGQFCDAMLAVGERCLPADATSQQKIVFYERLHLEDFTLAQACANGSLTAWESFFNRFSTWIYATAMTIAKNEQVAKDLSDSLAGDLFPSKLASYSGRGSLENWLRALLTHTYVDRFRSQSRMVGLDEQVEMLKDLCVAPEDALNTAGDRLNGAIEAAFLELPSADRFLLMAHFIDGWTLAKIAKSIGTHESSASRRLHRILEKLRKDISRRLQRAGLNPAQIKDSLSAKGWAVSIDIRTLLAPGNE